jgi:hypothetical protein
LTCIAATDIETAIYMPAKTGRAVKPRARAKEDAAHEPFRGVVAIGCAGVRGVVIVSVGAFGFGSDVDADLSFGVGSGR